MIKKFTPDLLKNLYKPDINSQGEDNGQVTIIGGSSLFHGAPLMALKSASRVVDMVFFSSPQASLKEVADKLKSELLSFIWVPYDEVGKYIEKSNACLIGPGMMRFNSENADHKTRTKDCDSACQLTKTISEELLTKYKDKKWVIDAGALQTIDPKVIPPGVVITPNSKELCQLFSIKYEVLSIKKTQEKAELIEELARKHKITILYKSATGIVSDGETTYLVEGGTAGLTKGGVGDVLAGLTVGLLAKNDGLLSAACASHLIKKQAERLAGEFYSADDLSEEEVIL